MGLKHLDLEDMITSKISLDEFEPKTGKIEDVIVIGFHAKEEIAGNDLYEFMNSGRFKINDVEVSPNPNPENLFMVFIEIPRNDDILPTLKEMVEDIENLTGKLKWRVTTHLTDDYYPLNDPQLEQYIITNPENYMDRKEFEAAQQENYMEAKRKSQEAKENAVLEFLKGSTLQHASIKENVLNLGTPRGIAQLRLVSFGKSDKVMKRLNIHESAIKEQDVTLRIFNGMLGEMKAEAIGDYIVIYHPHQENVLVTKIC